MILALLLAAASQGGAEPIKPACAAPGGNVTYTQTQSKTAVTKVQLLAIPMVVDAETAESSTDSVLEADWSNLGVFPLIDNGNGTTTLNAAFKLPTRTAYKGDPIDSWSLAAKLYDDAGTYYGNSGFGGFVDSSFKFAAIEDETVKGNEVIYRAHGFGTGKLTAKLKKGKKTKRFTLARSTDSLPCGAAFGRIPTSKLKKGTYKVKIGGKSAGKLKLI